MYREWNKKLKRITFILLNPSTATKTEDDSTITRCIEYAYSWGYGYLAVVNLFALREPNPETMKKKKHPIGSVNNYYIHWAVKHPKNSLTVAAWGNHGVHMSRSNKVKKLLTGVQFHCLKVTNKGEPNHPLYLNNKLRPTPYNF
ncbi:MAG: DUF1643 domain-containing protein [Firmicutes bacterium]|nr:DUF1643 domain-containing protein [Bacillota bacterium]